MLERVSKLDTHTRWFDFVFSHKHYLKALLESITCKLHTSVVSLTHIPVSDALLESRKLRKLILER